MLISAFDHYVLSERFVTTAKELREFITEVEAVAARDGCDVFWRGQADHRWGVTSSLARIADSPAALTDAELATAEKRLLTEAKQWVTSLATPPANDLEWLALLQHHGVPTRMLDFTPDPLIATFFASEAHDDIEGRIFGILVPHRDMRLTAADVATFDISNVPSGQIRLWQPGPHVSPRLAAQSGVFVVGKLPSTQVARFVNDKATNPSERLMVRSEIVSIMSIPLYMLPLGTTRRSTSTVLSCFTARIHVDKSSIRDQLSKKANRGDLRPSGSKIDHAYCYPDVEGMVRYSRVLKAVNRGLG
ncbi:hypothetical protein Ade02nite_82240 [Paractinoplanes deccanensis]|uniref:FRG domain-containing protein n=1 Tax=Paractinoplanes deccanensis TaxID=113561 RepID=A0ABQ3YHX8_9ACTN|nr:FRG domain-containing protein [Actinoplanes deccanensis]GID79583.1 hypothetical protein Ade02nite_82240 [Actinoplanes deccanensis]